MTRARHIFPIAVLTVLSLAADSTFVSAADEKQGSRALQILHPNEQNLRLLNVHISYHVFDDLVDAYAYENMTLVPLRALSNIVNLDISVEAEQGIAKGNLYDERKTFFLDAPRNEVILSGKRIKFDPEQVKLYPGDIYIDANLLSKWLPFKLDIDLFTAVLKISSEKKLPFEEKLARQDRYKEVQARNVSRQENRFPGYFEPYSGFEPPFITATLQSHFSQNEQSGQTTTGYSYSVHGTGDLAKMESSFYLAGDQDNPANQYRLTLGRKDRDGRLLGAMRASEYAMGHIYSPASRLISSPQLPSVGAMVSNYPLFQQGEYDRHDFRGELQDNWEVELYHNNALIGYQAQSANGQYAFTNIPLYFGRNYFRLVFYGPQGQKREETRNFDLESSIVKQGEHYYRVQTSEDLESGYHSGVKYDFGLGKNVSLSTEFQDFTLGSIYLLGKPAEKRSYARAGLRGMVSGMFLSGDVVTDNKNGSAVDLGISTRLGSENLVSLRGTQFDNFASEAFPLLSDPLKSQLEASIYTAIPASFIPRIPVTARLQQSGYLSGSARTQLDNRVSLNIGRVSASNSISMIQSTNQSDQTLGQFQLSTRSRRFGIRGDLGYILQPTSDITSVSLTVDNIKSGKGLYSFGVIQQLQSSATQYQVNYNRAAGRFSVNVGASYSTSGLRTLTLGLTTGLSREPRTPYWTMSSRPVSGTGAISARTFLDRNQDGLYNDGDQLLPDVQFKRDGNQMPIKTDVNGIAFITGLTSHYPTSLGVATETLEDPLWKPSIVGVELNPRPGSVAKVDFPILETGEIDGSIYLDRAGNLGGVGDVEVQLVNAEGKIVRNTRSAYDGFYLFSGLNYGTYLLRISPTQIESLKLSEVRPIQIIINKNTQFVSGINFRLFRR